MTQLQSHTPIGKVSSFRALPSAIGRPDNKQNGCGTGGECECEELCLRRGSLLACRVMCFASSSSHSENHCNVVAFV